MSEKTTAMTWRGQRRIINALTEALAHPQVDLQEVGRQIAGHCRQVESDIAAVDGPVKLSDESCRFRAWLKLFAEPQWLQRYHQAIQQARPVFSAWMARQFPDPHQLLITFKPGHAMWRCRSVRRQMRLQLTVPMICFQIDQFELLAQAIFQADRRASTAVQKLLLQPPASRIQTLLEDYGGASDDARGRVHDLTASFERVNRRYFGNRMTRPKLRWSVRPTVRRLGSYDYLADRLTVSRTLDNDQVPARVVDYIVYHELLHKKHGVRFANTTRVMHSAEFAADERRFEDQQEIETFIKQYIRTRGKKRR